MKKNSARLVALVMIGLAVAACSRLKYGDNTAPEGQVVAIAPFQCECDASLQGMVQDSFVGAFFKDTNTSPIQGERGDIVITGTFTTGRGSSAAWSMSNASSASGAVITSMSVQAHRDGKLIATHLQGATLRGGKMLTPAQVSARAASAVMHQLLRRDEIGLRE